MTMIRPILAALLAAAPVCVLEAPDPVVVPVCSATLIPNEVSVMTAPEEVVVQVLVAVVEAVQAVQVVHGASELHELLVQPDQVSGGQPLVPHHSVQGPLVQDPELPHGPDPQFPPKGPPKPPGPLPPHAPDHGPPDGPDQPELLVTVKVASGVAVTWDPTSAQSCAIF